MFEMCIFVNGSDILVRVFWSMMEVCVRFVGLIMMFLYFLWVLWIVLIRMFLWLFCMVWILKLSDVVVFVVICFMFVSVVVLYILGFLVLSRLRFGLLISRMWWVIFLFFDMW